MNDYDVSDEESQRLFAIVWERPATEVGKIHKIRPHSFTNSRQFPIRYIDQRAHRDKISPTCTTNDITGLADSDKTNYIFRHLLGIKTAITFLRASKQEPSNATREVTLTPMN